MNKKSVGKTLLFLGAFAVIVTLLGFALYRPVLNALMPWIVQTAMNHKNVQHEDGLTVGLCGTGSPMPDLHRAGACVAVLAGQHFFIVDAGEGSTKNVTLMGLPIEKTDAILLTHFHSDHIADLGEMMLQRWARGSQAAPVDVIGPVGVEQVVQGFNLAYQQDDAYRVAHHGADTVPPSGAGGVARPFPLADAPDASTVVYDRDGVKITMFKVDHRPVVPAVGYRFDYKGRSVVISGDTVYSESLLEHAKGADVLFHEALNPAMVAQVNANAASNGDTSLAKITQDIPSYHATPEDAAKIAALAGVKQLIYYHIIPPLPSPLLKDYFIGDAKSFFTGPITVGEDGLTVWLPPNSTQIQLSNTLN